ncbi:MAG: amidohydrolase [Thermaerobacter sp.]|nr:amidohydrolase [Thermaerobacter sp.]
METLHSDRVRQLAHGVREDAIAWRRHLHANPETSFNERETARYVFDQLASFGLRPYHPTPTSVVASIEGVFSGRCLAIRADMDALPITEETGLPFASQTPGAMHACGHDGHTAMLLGAAKVLSALRGELQGEVRLLFQHAEELFPGGAQEMVDAGVLDGVDMVIGTHLWLPLTSGRIGIAAGPLTAAPDTFSIEVLGRGGHAAQPHLTVDPVPLAAQIILALQQLVSREADPLRPAVLSVTQVHAGTADNVIPDRVTLGGTVRTFDEDVRKLFERRIGEVAEGLCAAFGATCTHRYQRGYRPIRNDAAVSAALAAALREVLGEEVVEEAVPSMVGEDFSAYQQRVPGCFFWLGSRNEAKGIVYPHHHARFTIDEDVLETGVAAFVGAALHLL